MDEDNDLVTGGLIGFIVGDALGSALEFSDRDSLNLITNMEKNYLYDYPVGSGTDKTSEMLCMADSIIEHKGFIYSDFLTKYHRFITTGYHSPNDKVFEVTYYVKEIGIKIGKCLKYRQHLPLFINPYDHHQRDCQPLLRILPIVLKYYQTPVECLHHVKTAVQLTHVSVICVDVCRFYANLMIGALVGVSKDVLLSEQFNIMDITTYGELRRYCLTLEYIKHCSDTVIINHSESQGIRCKSTKENKFLRSLFPAVSIIQKGSYVSKQRDDIVSDDDIINTLEAALWSFHNSTNFEDGCINAVNLGLNSSSIGAVYGQLAGLYYGLKQIPNRWTSQLQNKDYIMNLKII